VKILFVLSRFPYPRLGGDQVRAFHHIRLLSRDHEVFLVAPAPVAEHEASLAAVAPYCREIALVPRATISRIARLARAPFDDLPLQTHLFYTSALAAEMKRMCGRHGIDLVHAQLVRAAPVLAEVPRGIARVLDFVDALSVNFGRRAERSRGIEARLCRWEADRLGTYERRLMGVAHRAVISSDADRRSIGQWPTLHVVPNGVDLDEHRFVEQRRRPNSIVFTGTMYYFPNIDAATWFAREVLPQVSAQVGEVTFHIAGVRPSSSVRALAGPNIVVTGAVPSVHEYIARSTVSVAPMRSGSGGQFKVIEAMAAGTPVVATSFATGGIVAEPERHFLLADDAPEFARQVVRLLRDSALQSRLRVAGAALVQERYSWERTVSQLKDVYDLACHDVAPARNSTSHLREPA
jgi:sugar transferase (PEP-CTERM/EpsH1 system associated)